MLESAKVRKYPFSEQDQVVQPDWEVYIADLARFIVQDQTPKRLQEVRGKLYELLTHCISADVIIKTLTFEIIKLCDAGIVPEVIKYAAHYEHSLRLGTKAIFHLEAFVAKFMFIYKRHLVEMSMSMMDTDM
ncbi:Subunit of heteropentameric Replication factor C (RF-C) [Blyttiomyces sp. JEL0837]|nr:Subunit of heteropentameric Replication factor C (RF-C) [Blyttiomyces sp. JEL0837]